MLAHDPGKVPHVARCLVTEPEVLANDHRRGPELPDEHVPDELFGALLRERLVERHDEHLLGAGTQQLLPTSLERGEQPRRLAAPDHGPRVRPERRRDDPTTPTPRLLRRPRQDSPVAEMDPVKVAERHHYGAHNTTSALASAPSSL
jgi:hypothetical protein